MIFKCRKVCSIVSFVLIFVFFFNHVVPAFAVYSFSTTRKDTPQDFNAFLNACSDEERIQMLQALSDLPKLKDEYFGKLKGLPGLSSFTTDKNKASAYRPLKPETFNEVKPETVLDAVRKRILTWDDISVSEIRKALVWRAYNKATYYFRGDKTVDYHGILQWVAGKADIDEKQVSNLPTFALERKVAEKYFEALWDKLPPEQKKAVLDNVEKETGKIIHDKSSIVYMSGGAALAALSATINIMGFAFYTLLTSTIHVIAALFGMTLPWIFYQTATTWAAVLGGPIGWAISAVLVAVGVTFLGSAEKDTVSAFVMTVNMIKTHKWAE